MKSPRGGRRLGNKKKPTRRVARHVRSVDARGALCPVPTVMAALALEAGPAGRVVEIRADDPTTRRDLPLWCREFGHHVVAIEDRETEFRVRVRKGSLGGGPK